MYHYEGVRNLYWIKTLSILDETKMNSQQYLKNFPNNYKTGNILMPALYLLMQLNWTVIWTLNLRKNSRQSSHT